MTATEFLLWVRGPALTYATIIFVLGITVRMVEILALGRKQNLAEARGSEMAGGLRTIFTRTVPDKGTLKKSMFTLVSGYIFHLGLFITIFLFAPHILVFHKVFGLEWPALPTPIVDAVAAVSILALLAVLIHRIKDPVQRYLSRFEDYLVWLVTILPLITGYLAIHRFGLAPTMLTALHILSVELLMITFPFTKLMHAFSLFLARWYNGAISGYRGVQS